MKRSELLVVGFFVLVFVLIGFIVYFQFEIYSDIQELKDETASLNLRVNSAEAEVNSLGNEVNSWNTKFLEQNNQLNARMAALE